RSLNAFIPTTFTLDNYRQVFERSDFARFMFNSVVITSLTVTAGIFVNSMAAYVLARLKWRGRKLILGVVIALLIIPFETIAIPLLFVVTSLVWPDFSSGLALKSSWLNSYHV